MSHIPTNSHRVFVRKTVLQEFPSQRSCQLLGMLQPVLAYLDPKSVLKFVAELNESLYLYAQPSNGSKEVQNHCPDGLRTTDFPYEIFQHNSENRNGWTEEEAKKNFALFYLKCVTKMLCTGRF